MPEVQTRWLVMGYRGESPREDPVVLLLHGWPDDASTWDAIHPVLTRAGLRTLAPSARGFGGTRFLSPDAPRTGAMQRCWPSTRWS